MSNEWDWAMSENARWMAMSESERWVKMSDDRWPMSEISFNEGEIKIDKWEWEWNEHVTVMSESERGKEFKTWNSKNKI